MTDEQTESNWYTVRCVFQLDARNGFLYEERVTLWKAKSFDEAIAEAEKEASNYAETTKSKYLGLAQAYLLTDLTPPSSSTEVFSMIRESNLTAKNYLDRFFDSSDERQGHSRLDGL